MKRSVMFVVAMSVFIMSSVYSAVSVFIPQGAGMSNDDTVFTDIVYMKNVFIYQKNGSGEEIKCIFYSTQSGIGVSNTVVADTFRCDGSNFGVVHEFYVGRKIDSIYVYVEGTSDGHVSIWPSWGD